MASCLASYDAGATSPDATQVYDILDADIVSESSGIIDISEALDYQPGSIFLTTGFSNDTTKNQIAMCVAPGAKLRTEAYTDWIAGFASLDTAAKRLATADPDFDGLDNATEFALGLFPDTPETESPLNLEILATSTRASFTAPRSLDLVDYYVDYTQDLSTGFTETLTIRAADVGAGDAVVLTLPKANQLFARIRATLP